jgi:hypothetical protein
MAISSSLLRISLTVSVGAMLLSATPLPAQVDTGAILGTVSDVSKAIIRNASVTLTNEGTNASLTTTTGADGTYKFTPVRIGNYKGQRLVSRVPDNYPAQRHC